MKCALSTLVAALAGPSVFAQDAAVAPTIGDIVANSPDHTVLESAVLAAPLALSFLSSETNLTLFAPTDAAFEEFDPKFLEPQWNFHLSLILANHVLAGKVMSGDLEDGMVAETLSGNEVTVTVNDLGVSFSGAVFEDSTVIVADLQASNGVVHTVDGLFVPEFLTFNLLHWLQPGNDYLYEYTTLVSLIAQAGLEETLSGGAITLLAPPDSAFAAIPPAILEVLTSSVETLTSVLAYHVLDGVYASDMVEIGQEIPTLAAPFTLTVSNVSFDNQVVVIGSAVANADWDVASNGILWVLDSVLLPPEEAPPIVSLPSITDIVVASPDHTVLESALVAASSLLDLSALEGESTLFAPVDAAFEGFDTKYLEPQYIVHLVQILAYHVVFIPALAGDLTDGMILTMGNFDDVTVTVNDMGVSFSGDAFENVSVIAADIAASNGVIHVVDGLFVPNWMTHSLVYWLLPGNDDSYSYTTLVSLVTQAGLEETLSGGDITIMAPTDEAFAAVPTEMLEEVSSDMDTLKKVLAYHVLDGVYSVESVQVGQELQTLAAPLTHAVSAVDGSENVVTIGGVDAEANWDLANNGMLWVLGTVLLPPADPTDAPVTPEPTGTPVAAPVAEAPVAAEETEAPVAAPSSRGTRLFYGGMALFGAMVAMMWL